MIDIFEINLKKDIKMTIENRKDLEDMKKELQIEEMEKISVEEMTDMISIKNLGMSQDMSLKIFQNTEMKTSKKNTKGDNKDVKEEIKITNQRNINPLKKSILVTIEMIKRLSLYLSDKEAIEKSK